MFHREPAPEYRQLTAALRAFFSVLLFGLFRRGSRFSSSSSTSEDSDAEALTEAVEKDFMKTLAKLKCQSNAWPPRPPQPIDFAQHAFTIRVNTYSYAR